MGLIDELIQGLQTFVDHNIDKVTGIFNPEFWGLIGYTALGAVLCVALPYFFPALRSFAGALFFAIPVVWYGFDRGQRSMEKPKKGKR